MNYIEYIDLEFYRIDQNDEIEFIQTGYLGFILCKDITSTISIEVLSTDLNSPKMYITKENSDICHIIPLTTEMVKDMLS